MIEADVIESAHRELDSNSEVALKYGKLESKTSFY